MINNAKSDKFVIEETLKRSFKISLCIIICFEYFLIAMAITFLINPPKEIQPNQLFIFEIVFWIAIVAVPLITIPLLRGLRELRTFEITANKIEIKIPSKDRFKIEWSEFDKIQVEKRERVGGPILPPTYTGIRYVFYNLIFKKDDQVVRNFEFESGRDFKVRSRKKIIFNLQEFAQKKDKIFIS